MLNKNYQALKFEKIKDQYAAVPSGGSLYYNVEIINISNFIYNDFLEMFIDECIYNSSSMQKDLIELYFDEELNYKSDENFNIIEDMEGNKIYTSEEEQDEILNNLIKLIFK